MQGTANTESKHHGYQEFTLEFHLWCYAAQYYSQYWKYIIPLIFFGILRKIEMYILYYTADIAYLPGQTRKLPEQV